MNTPLGNALPCPFCNSTDTCISHLFAAYSYVMCNTCGAKGPNNTTHQYEDINIKNAITAWNTRTGVPCHHLPEDYFDAGNGIGIEHPTLGAGVFFTEDLVQSAPKLEPVNDDNMCVQAPQNEYF